MDFFRSVQDCAVVCPPGTWWLPKGDASDRLIWIWDLLTFCFDFIYTYSGMHLLVLFPVDETYSPASKFYTKIEGLVFIWSFQIIYSLFVQSKYFPVVSWLLE